MQIWCCRNHGKLVDDDVSHFSVEVLRAAKARAIDRARRSLLTGDLDPDGYRKQAHVTRHQIARETVASVYELRSAMPTACDVWGNWRSDNAVHAPQLIEALGRLDRAIERFKAARDEVRAVWGEYVAAPLQSAGDMCSILLTGIVMDVRNSVPKLISDRDFAETRDGARRREEILDFMTLIEEWAAPYLGRDGALELTEDELEARSWRLHGLPEDQVSDIVETGRLVRAAKRAGASRAAIKKMLADRSSARSLTPKLSTAPLDSPSMKATVLLTELERVVRENVEHGETALKIRLADQYDQALETALESSPGAIAVLGEQVQALAKRYPTIEAVEIAAGGLPRPGWTFPKK